MSDEKDDAGRRKVGGLVHQAVGTVQLEMKRRRAAYPERGKPHDGIEPGGWLKAGYTDETGELPENCPARPLGYEGENYSFVDTMGQIFNSGDSALGVERLQKLFAGHEAFLEWAWPAYDKKGRVTGFKAEAVRRALFAACRERGAWSMSSTIRGRGAWRDSQGKLILHCGDRMWIDNRVEDTGEIDAYFYPRRPKALVPWPDPVVDNPCVEIMKMLRTWNFARGDTDAMFVLGWIGVAMLGGALDWRPSIFAVGDAGTGKSELFGKHGLLRAVLGRMMISTTNASEAGLYQLVGHDSLPIAIDELEGDEGLDQARKIIKMARDAASGSVRIRGGQNHKGVEFEAQSTFSFSGINPPPIPPANLTRLVIIEMLPLQVSATNAPVLKAAETVGPRLLRILSDGWENLQFRLNDYYNVLREAGHNSRGQKTFGTFLAVAHTMLGEKGLQELGLPHDGMEGGLSKWGQILAPDLLPELEGVEATWKQAFNLILASMLENYSGGQRKTVGQELHRLKLDLDTLSDVRYKLDGADLGLLGDGKRCLFLAIPNQSRQLGKALLDTPFGDKGGNGAWFWALRRGPPEIIMKQLNYNGVSGNRVTVAGRQQRCTFVDLMKFWKSEET